MLHLPPQVAIDTGLGPKQRTDRQSYYDRNQVETERLYAVKGAQVAGGLYFSASTAAKSPAIAVTNASGLMYCWIAAFTDSNVAAPI